MSTDPLPICVTDLLLTVFEFTNAAELQRQSSAHDPTIKINADRVSETS